VHQRSATLDADVVKLLERTEQHREAAQLHAVVENQLREIWHMLCDIIGQAVGTGASKVEFGKLMGAWRTMRASKKKKWK
jgi:hypothetical protein